MNSFERVLTALQHKTPDRIPVYPLINSVSRHVLGINYEEWTKNTDLCAEAILKTTDELDLDCICSLVDLSVEAADWGQELIYFENEAACPDHNNRLVKCVEDFKNIKKINPRETPRMSEHIKLCKKLVDAKKNEVPVVGFVFGPLGIASMLRGQAEIFMDIFDEPELVKEAVEEITQTLEEYVTALIDTGVDAIMFDTLFASQTIMSKDMWDEFEGPYIERLAKLVHDKGVAVMIHNCGGGVYFDVQIARMQPEAISFLHIPDDCTSLENLKEKYGSKTTLIGCVSPGWIASATIEEVEEECRKEIEVLGKGGGFILATGCEYPAFLDFEKAKAMVRVAKEYKNY
ncbi:hypothetical protein SH2C18_50590 [Clostridium sediminicola]|uniref:uroporphyrinogen decarboxylase family protein n=1 Tax=Clostridium sediminicola TaxID=3114879 RepID=UPI0031F2751E